MDQVESYVKTGDFKAMYDPVSILVRIVDNQRAAHYLQDFEEYEPSKRLMLQKERSRYNKSISNQIVKYVKDYIP